MVESFCYGELGLKPNEYYALTFRQYMLMSDAYKRKIEIEHNNIIDSWRQTRLIAFLLIRDSLKDKSVTMQEFLPLPGDPTKEELAKARAKEIEADGKWQKSLIEKHRLKRKKQLYGV